MRFSKWQQQNGQQTETTPLSCLYKRLISKGITVCFFSFFLFLQSSPLSTFQTELIVYLYTIKQFAQEIYIRKTFICTLFICYPILYCEKILAVSIFMLFV